VCLTHLTEIVVTLLSHSKHDGDQFILRWKALKEGLGKEHMHRAFTPSQPDKKLSNRTWSVHACLWALHAELSRMCSSAPPPWPPRWIFGRPPPHIRETCVPCLHGNEATECTRAPELDKMHTASRAWRESGHASASTACTRCHLESEWNACTSQK
jgi:hypothetical protein